MTNGSTISRTLEALDRLLSSISAMGETGADVVTDARRWRDGVLRAQDAAWARYYVYACLQSVAGGVSWRLAPEIDLDAEVAAIHRNIEAWQADAYADMELRAAQQAAGIRDDQIIREEGRPPTRA